MFLVPVEVLRRKYPEVCGASLEVPIVKNLPAMQETRVQSLGRSPGEGNDNPLQYSRLENPRDRAAWRAVVHRVAKSWTQLSD